MTEEHPDQFDPPAPQPQPPWPGDASPQQPPPLPPAAPEAYAPYGPYGPYSPYGPYAPSEPPALPRPFYGGWATFGLGVAALGVNLVGAMAVLAVYIFQELAKRPNLRPEQLIQQVAQNGTAISLSIIVGAILSVAFVLLMVRVKRFATMRSHLALAGTSWMAFLACMGVYVLYFAAMVALSLTSDRQSEADDMMRAIYTSTAFKPLLWAAICLIGPLFEELLFRGFLLAGFRHSRLGPTGAVVLTSLMWTVIHIQYGAYELSLLFVLGLMLGAMTVKTRSILPAIVVHVVNNLIATGELAHRIAQGAT